jgi:DNA-directed RNA polymerase subunit RPC12/RpoP
LEKITANFFAVLSGQDTDTHNKIEFIESYFTIFSPPVFYGFNKIIENNPIDFKTDFPDDKEGMIKGYFELVTDSYPRNLLFCIIISSVMMLITLRHGWARKNKFTLVLWALFVGLFNIAGLLTYLALNHTTTIKCPACGKKRNLEKDECIRCGAKLPEAKSVVIAD